MKLVLSIGLLVIGGCLVTWYYLRSEAASTGWTAEQQESFQAAQSNLAIAKGSIFKVLEGKEKPVDVKNNEAQRAAAEEEMAKQQAAFDAAIAAGKTTNRIIYWSGVSFICLAVAGLLSARNE